MHCIYEHQRRKWELCSSDARVCAFGWTYPLLDPLEPGLDGFEHIESGGGLKQAIQKIVCVCVCFLTCDSESKRLVDLIR